MKCICTNCNGEAVRHIVEIKERRIVSQRDYCEGHFLTHKPAGESISTYSSGEQGQSRFELDYVTFFDNYPADAIRLRQLTGPKFFSIPVLRYETYGVVLFRFSRIWKIAPFGLA
jgi:hypothetical protein